MIKAVNSDLITFCQKIIVNSHRVAILDSETTGKHGEIIDLAIVDPDGNVLYNSLLKPQCSIEKEAQEIHHIDEAMLIDAPSFGDEWPCIYEAIKGRIVIAYNAEFDHGRFRYTAQVHGISLPDSTWQCLMRSYAQYFDAPPRFPNRPQPAWQKLEKACNQQGIAIGQQEHRALSDTLTTLALIKRIAELGSATRKYSETPEPWESLVSIEKLLSKPRPQGQDSAFPESSNTFQGTDMKSSDSQRGAILTLPVKEAKPSLGQCCKPGCNEEATLSSPSSDPQSIYCAEHGKSQCEQHTIEDFVYCNIRNAWLDPCIANKEIIDSEEKPKQQTLLLVS